MYFQLEEKQDFDTKFILFSDEKIFRFSVDPFLCHNILISFFDTFLQ